MTTSATLKRRRVRYADLKPCYNAFIDTRTPGSEEKENFTIIGPGVSENPDQFVHIAEPHGFNIGGARQPPGCVNSQHSHNTAEVFIVHSGRWRFDLGETGDDARVELGVGDVISIPTGIFRGFTNTGAGTGYLFAILGGDDPGRVTWAPHVFELAKAYGLVLLESGRLVDTAKGERVPEGEKPMAPPDAERLASMREVSQADAERFVWRASDRASDGSDVVIGPDGFFEWEHGFTIARRAAGDPERAGRPEDGYETRPSPRVVFVQAGAATVVTPSDKIVLGPGDTFSVPAGLRHRIDQDGASVAFVIDRAD